MEFPILTRMPLPLPAIRTVTKFLQPDPHPTAMLIKALTFKREDATEVDNGWGILVPEPASLTIRGPGIRNKDLSTPWPHSYVIRDRITPYNDYWASRDMIYQLWFAYDEHTGERCPRDDDSDDDDEVDDIV